MTQRLLLLLPSSTYRAAAFVEAARRLGVELTVASDQRSTFEASQPANLLYLKCDDPADVEQRVRRFAQSHPIDAVAGVDDGTAVAAAVAARALGLAHNPVAACEIARDKHRQRVVLAAAGVPVPAFALHRFDGDLEAAARQTPYPCVLKPTHLAMSRGVIRADDPASFVRAANRIASIVRREGTPAEGRVAFLAERYVPGDEYALEGLLDHGTLRTLALFDKPDPLTGPFFAETIYATPSRLAAGHQEAIARTVEGAARAMGLVDGPVHAEIRFNDEGPWIIEVAARPIGGRCSAILRFGERADISLEQLLLAHALGARIGDREPSAISREPGAAAVMMIPIERAGRLVRVDGVTEARRVPWIDDVVITAHPGQDLEALPEGSLYLGFIYAWAADVSTCIAAVREAHARLKPLLE